MRRGEGLFGGAILGHSVPLTSGIGMLEAARARPFPLWDDESIVRMFCDVKGWSTDFTSRLHTSARHGVASGLCFRRCHILRR